MNRQTTRKKTRKKIIKKINYFLSITHLKSIPKSLPGVTLHTAFSCPSNVIWTVPSWRLYPSIVLSLLPVMTMPSGNASHGGSQQMQDTKLLWPLYVTTLTKSLTLELLLMDDELREKKFNVKTHYFLKDLRLYKRFFFYFN